MAIGTDLMSIMSRVARVYSDYRLADVQILYLGLALRLLDERSVLDGILQAAEQGNAFVGPNDLIWMALQPNIHALGYDIPAKYSVNDMASEVGSPTRDLTEWRTMAATERKTGNQVMLKISWVSTGSSLREVGAYETLLSEPHAHDPRNPVLRETRIVDIYDQSNTTVQAKLLIMPYMSPLDHLAVRVKAFRLDCVRQMMESLVFLHSLGICHGDIHISNMVTTRLPPFRVYFIDFDLSRKFESSNEGRLTKWEGGKIMPPEVEEDDSIAYDPFAADIYALGWVWAHFDPQLPLAEMWQLRLFMHDEDPAERLTAEVALRGFDFLYQHIPWYRLLSPTIHLRIWWDAEKSYFFKELFRYLHDLLRMRIYGIRART